MSRPTKQSIPAVESVGQKPHYPLSFEQQRFYAVQRFSEGARSASIPVGIELEGPLDARTLAACLPMLVERHASLRTVIREIDGEPVQVILPTAAATLTRHSLLGLGADAAQRRVGDFIERDLKQPFDLSTGPLCRFILLELAPEKHVFLLSFHHIIADFISIGILLDELSEIYTALLEERVPALSPPTLRFVDFASWERTHFTEEYRDRALDFWRSALARDYDYLDLPYDRPDPGRQVFPCMSEVLDFDAETQARVGSFCRSNDLSKFVLYLAASATLLRGYTGNQRMVFGIPLANRNFPEIAQVVGTFANQSIVTIDLSGNPSFRELFSTLAQSLRCTMTRVVPIVDLIHIMRKQAAGRQRPLQIALTYLTDDVYRTNIPGTTSRPLKTGRDSLDIDLFFTVVKHASGEALSIEYGGSLFEPSTILEMLDKFCAVLDLITSNPDRRVDDIFSSGVFEPRRTLHVVSTFVSEPVEDTLRFWLRKQRIGADVRFAPYNQVFQQLLDPRSELYGNSAGYNVLIVRLEDWVRERLSTASPASEIERATRELSANVSDLIEHLQRAATRSRVPLVVAIAPDSPFMQSHESWVDATCAAASALGRAIDALGDVSLLDARAAGALYGLGEIHDSVRDELAHIPYTSSFYVALGTAIARHVFALETSHRYKVVVVDCDNTLWRGVVGEDGAEGIVISPAMRAFQEKLIRLRDAGMLICVCSKNAERDVLDVFENNPDMALRLDDVVAAKVNWQPKSDNVRELARELNLGLDSFVFVDDNPVECAEMRARCPEVSTLQFPASERAISEFTDHVWLFDRPSGTAEDRQRTQRYKENVEREASRKGAASMRAFIEELSLQISIEALDRDDLGRVSQLTYRTNQFNTTTHRRSESELAELFAAGYRCSTVSVEDRFGSYGLVGAMIYRASGAELAVDTFLLSCRALGKGVEHAMLSELASIGESCGCTTIRIETRRTEKNEPARAFLSSVVGRFAVDEEGERRYVVPTEAAQAIDFLDTLRDVEDVVPDGPSQPSSRGHANGRARLAFVREAWEKFGTLAAVEREVRREAWKPARGDASRGLRPPQTELERALARIWSEVLDVAAIDADEDLFAIGGSSFDVVEILSRIVEVFDVPFDHHTFLRSPTIESVAGQIEHYRERGTFCEEGDSVDLVAESELAPDISPTGSNAVVAEHPKRIFVTGVTGFLGAHLLRELLEQTDASLFCHVRAQSREHGLERVIDNLKRYEVWQPDYASRLRIVRGDLAEPRLGIEEREYARLAEGIDLIYHNGSVVDFIRPYSALERANVVGTEEILRLACRDRIQPVVYVSTIAVFNALGATADASGRVIPETFLCASDSAPLGGYAQTKWVAERLVAEASARGVPVCIFRPGEIGGSAESGLMNESDILSVLFRAMVGMGCLPDIETRVDFIPVDFLSRTMVRISLTQGAMGRVYNLVHPQPVLLATYADEVNALGRPPVELAPYSEWTSRLAEHAEKTGDLHIKSLMHLFTERTHGDGVSWIESTASRPAVSMSNVAKHLVPEELRAVQIDRGLIARYLSRLRPGEGPAEALRG